MTFNGKRHGEDIDSVRGPIGVLRDSRDKVLLETLVNGPRSLPVVEDLHEHGQSKLGSSTAAVSPTQTVWTVIHQVVSWVERAHLAVTHHEDLFVREIGVSVFLPSPDCIAGKGDAGGETMFRNGVQ